MLTPEQKTVALERLGFALNESQAAILTSAELVKLVSGGERAGKSLLAGAHVATEAPAATLIWLVGKDYSLARAEFTYAYNALRKAGAVRRVSMPSDGPWTMTLKTGGVITTKSSEDILKLAQDAPSGVVLCEAAQLSLDAFERLFARTAEGRARGDGWMLLVGTFEKGRRWYAEMWRQLQGENVYAGRSWSLPTWTNTAVFPGGRNDPAVKAIEAGLTADQFRERFGGEPVAHEGQVFRGESIEKCVGPLGQPDGWTVLGCDLARVRDYTVVTAINSRREVVEVQRFNKIDWALQVKRIAEMFGRLGAQRITVDATGPGDPVVEAIRRADMVVEPYVMTSGSKAALIDGLSLALDRHEITIPREPQLLSELWDFEATETAGGHERMEAPPGKHDDMVISLALAVHAIHNRPYDVPAQPPPEKLTQLGRWRREIYAAAVRPKYDPWS